jgi:hypothetical protein
MGREAKVKLTTGELEGELLSVSGDSLWILSSGTLHGHPLGEVRELKVRMHNWGSGRALKWTLLGGLGSAVALTAACNSVEGTSGCGGVLVSWSLVWGLIGGLAGTGLASSSQKKINPSFEALRPYVRYPQGLPEKARSGYGPRRNGG